MINELEKYSEMSTEDLHGLFSDWYKDVEGIRPRHISSKDREAMLDWIAYEITPEVQAIREAEIAKWNADFDERCRQEDFLEKLREQNYQRENWAEDAMLGVI